MACRRRPALRAWSPRHAGWRQRSPLRRSIPHDRQGECFELASREIHGRALVIVHPVAIYKPSNRMEMACGLWQKFTSCDRRLPTARKLRSTLASSISDAWISWSATASTLIVLTSIRTAVRNQLERHDDTVRQSVARRQLTLGLSHYTVQDLEAARNAGRRSISRFSALRASPATSRLNSPAPPSHPCRFSALSRPARQ